MRCPVQNGNPDILLDYCARRLSPEAGAILVQHMAVCVDCRRVAEAQEAVWSAMDSWKPAPISDDFDERLYARITADERRSFWRRVFGDRLSWKPALPLAAGCAAMALAVFVSIPGQRPLPSHVQEVRVESIEPEQLERAVEDMDMLRQFSTPAQIQKL
jgi:hypothetical protein